MAVMAPTRRQRKTVNPTTGSGGGGSRTADPGRYRDWGKREEGAYNTQHDRVSSALGPSTEILDGLQKHTGVKDLFRPGLINSSIAGRAEAYAKTQVPQLLENAKTYYTAVETSSAADLKVKEMRVKAAAKHSINLTNQQMADYDLIQQEMSNATALAGKEWETGETYIQCQASLAQLAKATTVL